MLGAMALHDILASKRDDIVARWVDEVRGTIAPEAMPPVELEDHIPRFVDEILASLREDAGLPTSGETADGGATAAGHGAQRLRLGFGLDSVVREYGCLRAVILDAARDAGADPTLRELEVLFDAIIHGIAFAVTEYTKQRDAETLRQANEHFSFIAHELRNPLSSALTSFEVLQRRNELPAEGRSVGSLERGLRRAVDLIDQTLVMARIASGVELRRTSTTLATLFEEAELGASSEADARSVKLHSLIENDAALELDVRLVRSALGNLLGNAVKYTHEGGEVELRGRVTNELAIIEVEDSCGGLEPGKVEQAFAPFVRLDAAQTGFGLGLAIAKQAVDAHGGSLRVQNLPGKGCIFVLELPLA